MKNREIKFRAWHSVRKDMYSGEGIMQGLFINYESDDGTASLDTTIKNLQEEYQLMQFTGLHDKNGKEIYEGDIVDSWAGLKDNTEPYIRTVVWKETGLRFEPLTGYNLCKQNQHLFEVIGNIHEHPELLTSQTK